MEGSKVFDEEDILKVLYSQPSADKLKEVLEEVIQIQDEMGFGGHLNIKITNVLVNEILPEYLPLIFSKNVTLTVEKLKVYLRKCLSNIGGIKAILMRIKNICEGSGSSSFFLHIGELLKILQEILCNEGNLISTWIQCHSEIDDEKKVVKHSSSLVWNEYISLIAGGRILGIASEGQHKLWQYYKVDDRPIFWIADGSKYAEHLGNEIIVSVNDSRFNEKMEYDFSKLIGRLFSLGYTGYYIFINITYLMKKALIISSFFQNNNSIHNDLLRLHRIMKFLTFSQKTVYIHSLFSFFDKRYFQCKEDSYGELDVHHELFTSEVKMVSDMIKDLLFLDNDLIIIIDNWLLNYNFKTRIYTRIATINSYYSFVNNSRVDENILEKLCTKWSGKIFINNIPLVEQEILTQTFLLSVAFVSRDVLEKLSHSKVYLDGLTNRLSSSSERARFLGMIVGESVTRKLFPNDEKKWLTFNVEDTLTVESNWWRNIVNVNEIINMKDHSLNANNKYNFSSDDQQSIVEQDEKKIQSIQKEDDGVVSSDDEFIPYSLPDSDDDDSDDDPTVMEKNRKVNAPVYIRELISMLKDNTSYPKIYIALKTSPDLIRRKANFGTELSKEAITLARIISSMNDEFNMDRFIEMKQESMTALVAACPELVAPYFIEEYFTGDISIQQRYMILSSLALGAREISGIETPLKNKTLFPSKLLTKKLHQQYLSPVDLMTKEISMLSIEHSTPDPTASPSSTTNTSKQHYIKPPLSILKEKRFSKKTDINRNKSPPKANPLAPLAGKYFIFPIIGHWWSLVRSA
ncbi:hypothetical protein PORY_000778 [Pneumocystis oryctolagi]|uniref:Uncharacterized protein n=1 Tax=Pneumocystis oryctolagi TaxID=42067 RepID=A0ACB7CFT6_9ASCO|nr:hypothetical protein PORY_000778 [Pneumocystis oryctolagi]